MSKDRTITKTERLSEVQDLIFLSSSLATQTTAKIRAKIKLAARRRRDQTMG